MTARDTILNKLREARTTDRAPAQPVPDVAGYYAALPAALPLSERIAQLRRNLQAAHADVLMATAQSWPALLAAHLAEQGVQRIAVPQGCAAAAQLQAAAPALHLSQFDQPIEAWRVELLDKVEAGFTIADSAIANTGALIFKSSAQQPRSLSLVPPLHIAVLHAASIHADLYSAARDEGWAQGMPTNLIMVSGPSKTSDIQQTLAYGAHGPKALLVVIISDEVSP